MSIKLSIKIVFLDKLVFLMIIIILLGMGIRRGEGKKMTFEIICCLDYFETKNKVNRRQKKGKIWIRVVESFSGPISRSAS